jgi:hypothetical protein
MSDKTQLRLAISLIVLVGLILIGTIIGTTATSHKQECKTYCNCSITQDCPFTFDWDDIKDCDCGK